jgi:pimeloyl-ACP methyl ester carboxylesterase
VSGLGPGDRLTQRSGVRLAYEEAGTGAPAVVLVHGWAFGNRSHMSPQLAHLKSRHRVLALDLPGHGGSEPAPPGFGFQDCAAAIVGVLDKAGVDQAVVCGHSFGGRLAVEVAAAYPERLAGAALLDPVILFPDKVREQAVRMVPALESEGWLNALEAYFSRLLSTYDPPDLKARILGELGQVPRQLAAQVMRDGMSTDGAESVARVKCPLLVIRRTETPIDMERLARLQPEAWVGCVVGTGHWIGLAVPDQVDAMLDRFLEAITVRTT